MYSQSNEDNILRAIFGRYSRGNFVEFGSGDGQQVNTGALLERGWRGLWFEPHKRRFLSARERWQKYIDSGHLLVRRYRVIPEKVNLVVHDPLDFLSIDVDGFDYEIWEALEARPRVVCIECGPQARTSHHAMSELGKKKGYTLWTISSNAANAFFMRNDL